MTAETVFATIALSSFVLTVVSGLFLIISFFVDDEKRDKLAGFYMVVAMPTLVMSAIVAFSIFTLTSPSSQHAGIYFIQIFGVMLALWLMARAFYLWISVPRCPCAHAESAKKAA
ncbi:MAG: hypothetical protein HYT22_03530 [Candidatus Niyogibacteria bacterium]|nr:hypothetical protein [Candidatus Niyogibacteria bacterium]